MSVCRYPTNSIAISLDPGESVHEMDPSLLQWCNYPSTFDRRPIVDQLRSYSHAAAAIAMDCQQNKVQDAWANGLAPLVNANKNAAIVTRPLISPEHLHPRELLSYLCFPNFPKFWFPRVGPQWLC